MDGVSASQLMTEGDGPNGHLVVNVILQYDSEVDFEHFASVFTDCYLSDSSSRLHQRVCVKNKRWVPAVLDVSRHVKRGPCLSNHQCLNDFISRKMRHGLPWSRPPWQIRLLVVNGKSIALFRFHHVLADGVTMLKHLMDHATSSPLHQIQQPTEPTTQSLTMIFSFIIIFIKTLLKLIFLPADKPSALRSNSVNQFAIQFRRINVHISDIKSFCKSNSPLTVNDVLISALCESLRNIYPELPPEIISATWVGRPGNRWGNDTLGVVYLRLPLRVSRPDQYNVLKEVHMRMKSLKSSPEAWIVNKSLKLVSYLDSFIPRVMKLIFCKITNKSSISFSSLRGPIHSLKWPRDVATVSELFVLTPPVQDMGLMVNVLSYSNDLFIGLTSNSITAQLLSELMLSFEQALENILK